MNGGRIFRLAVLLLLSVAATAGCSDDGPAGPTSYVGYYIGSDDRRLVLIVQTGPLDEIVEGFATEEQDAVIVEVSVNRSANQPAVAVRKEVEIVLSEPIGEREVRTRSGDVLNQLTQPEPS